MGALTEAAFQIYAIAKEDAVKAKEAMENQALADDARRDALQRGKLEAGKVRTENTKLLAKQGVAFSSSGVDATVGTPASVMAETAAMGELDARTIENNALREAWGFKKHGIKFQQQAALDSARARERIGATVLTGVGRAFKDYSK